MGARFLGESIVLGGEQGAVLGCTAWGLYTNPADCGSKGSARQAKKGRRGARRHEKARAGKAQGRKPSAAGRGGGGAGGGEASRAGGARVAGVGAGARRCWRWWWWWRCTAGTAPASGQKRERRGREPRHRATWGLSPQSADSVNAAGAACDTLPGCARQQGPRRRGEGTTGDSGTIKRRVCRAGAGASWRGWWCWWGGAPASRRRPPRGSGDDVDHKLRRAGRN